MIDVLLAFFGKIVIKIIIYPFFSICKCQFGLRTVCKCNQVFCCTLFKAAKSAGNTKKEKSINTIRFGFDLKIIFLRDCFSENSINSAFIRYARIWCLCLKIIHLQPAKRKKTNQIEVSKNTATFFLDARK